MDLLSFLMSLGLAGSILTLKEMYLWSSRMEGSLIIYKILILQNFTLG